MSGVAVGQRTWGGAAYIGRRAELSCAEREDWCYSKGQDVARLYRISRRSPELCPPKFSSFGEQFTLVTCKWGPLVGITRSLLEEVGFIFCHVESVQLLVECSEPALRPWARAPALLSVFLTREMWGGLV